MRPPPASPVEDHLLGGLWVGALEHPRGARDGDDERPQACGGGGGGAWFGVIRNDADQLCCAPQSLIRWL